MYIYIYTCALYITYVKRKIGTNYITRICIYLYICVCVSCVHAHARAHVASEHLYCCV